MLEPETVLLYKRLKHCVSVINIPRRQTDVHNLNAHQPQANPPTGLATLIRPGPGVCVCVCVSLCVHNFPDDDDLHPQTPAFNSAHTHTQTISCRLIVAISFSSCFLLSNHSIYHHGNKRWCQQQSAVWQPRTQLRSHFCTSIPVRTLIAFVPLMFYHHIKVTEHLFSWKINNQ